MNTCQECFKRLKEPNATVVKVEKCDVCKGLLGQTHEFVKRITKDCTNIEFKTFLIGCTLPRKVLAKDKELSIAQGLEEPLLKRSVNTAVGMELEKQGFGTVDFKDPDLHIVIDVIGDKVTVRIKPVYVFGYYRKLVRDIPQTKWPCRSCKGQGCKKCDHTGLQYKESVEQLVSPPLLKASKAKSESFHGSGREDIDARMIAEPGRPFILELTHPLVRTLDYKALEKAVAKHSKGRVEVHKLRSANKKEIPDLKASKESKTYRATVQCEEPVSKEALQKLVIKDVQLEQRTPQRVSHRRADLVRKRTVYEVKVSKIGKTKFDVEIHAESGTYIKEFISGDGGRTKPSISELLKNACKCIELDVIGYG